MQLFFLPSLSTELIELNAEESRHIVKVLRKRAGDRIQFTDGRGNMAEAVLEDTSKQLCKARIIEVKFIPEPLPRLHLGIAPTKNHDRLEWCIEKCTEIGLSSIVPLICDYSERPALKVDRLHKIIQSAIKQSQQFHLPILHELQSFSNFVHEHKSTGAKYIAWCGDAHKSLVSELLPASETTILIGPEGDFSEAEIQQAWNNGYKSLSLGHNRLRTETAAIMACAAFQTINLQP